MSFENVRIALQNAMDDWGMMQKTVGDEGADWAERFERDFYVFIEEFEKWFTLLDEKPKTIEEAEKVTEIQEVQTKLPGPLQLNFEMELERIVDGKTDYWFD
ncbi:hypothetical protein [Fredinandcohnia sp. 179-A 10B2 NHS]|uniref:hypothetical protein n=1 Tax=Fredinandcohnia sp. 179-A 10B2 NHS TaxID=3235176 RepID=UPI00399F2352